MSPISPSILNPIFVGVVRRATVFSFARLAQTPQQAAAAASKRRHLILSRFYSSASSDSKRKAVTPFNDNGHVPWSDLSRTERVGRVAQQSINFAMVLLGIALTGAIGFVLYSDVFSPHSKVSHFNRAVDRIRADPACIRLLGDGSKIVAFGEPTSTRWRKARPIASTTHRDSQGNERVVMHFNVRGPNNGGTARLQLVKRPGHTEYEYGYFYVEVSGQPRLYLEKNTEAFAQSSEGPGTNGVKLLGIRWS